MIEKVKYVDEKGRPFVLLYNKTEYWTDIKRLITEDGVQEFLNDYGIDHDIEDIENVIDSLNAFSQQKDDYWIQQLQDMPRKKNGTLYKNRVSVLWSHDAMSYPDPEINNMRKFLIRIKAINDSTVVIQMGVYNVPY